MSDAYIVRRGGGAKSDVFAFIVVTYPAGSTLTATNGTKTLTAGDTTGTWMFNIPEAGTWDIVATNGADNVGKSVTVAIIGEIINVELTIPIEYQEVQFLQSSRHQYIDTLFLPTDKTTVRLKCHINSVNAQDRFFGTDISKSYYDVYADGSKKWNSAWGTGTSTGVGSVTVGDYIIELNGPARKVYIKNFSETVLNTVTLSNTTFSSPASCFVFARRAENYNADFFADIKVYWMEILQNNALVRKYIPCYRKSDSVAGLWELTEKSFYVNSGTGTFVVGEDV